MLVADCAGHSAIYRRGRPDSASLGLATINEYLGHWAGMNRLEKQGWDEAREVVVGRNGIIHRMNDWGFSPCSFHTGRLQMLLCDRLVSEF